MQDWIRNLLALQDVDVQAAKLLDQVAHIPEKKDEVRQQCEAEAASCREAEAALRAIELESRDLETQIDQLLTKKRDFQTKSTMIRNNDEYKAALLQIELCDKSVGDLEEKQLDAMFRAETAREVVAERRTTAEIAKKQADEKIAQYEDLAKHCQEQADEVLAGRDELRSAVREDILKIYDRLRSSVKNPKTRPCVVPVEAVACSRCRMKVTTQLYHDAMNGKLVICPTCGAILYQ